MPGARRDWNELHRVVAELSDATADVDRLSARRRVLVRRLVRAGVKQVEIAPVLGCSPMNVSYLVRDE